MERTKAHIAGLCLCVVESGWCKVTNCVKPKRDGGEKYAVVVGLRVAA